MNPSTNQPSKSTPVKFSLILILGLLTAIGPFSIDMYLPAFPEIATGLHTSIAKVMLSLSSFFIGISLGQLVYGPLLERYGRKPPLYAGLVLYLLAAIGCSLAPTVESLIAFRFIQALGGCVGMVAARAIVRDLFDVNQNAKVFSMLMLVVAVSPIIAPTAGGYITATFGWRVVFWALVVIAIAILAGIYFILPESKKPDPNFSLKAKPMLKNYWSILQQPQFYTFAFTGAIAYGGLYAYVSGSPQVFMGVFAVSEKQFGWIFAAIAIGLITASQINNRLLKKYSSEQIIMMALAFQSLIGIALFSGAVLQFLNLPLTITLIFLFLSCQGFIFPNASALTMAAFGHTAGSASGLMGAIQLSVGALASAIVSKLENQTTLPMTGVMCFCASLALFIFIAGRKMQIRKATLLAVEEEEVDMMGNL